MQVCWEALSIQAATQPRARSQLPAVVAIADAFAGSLFHKKISYTGKTIVFGEEFLVFNPNFKSFVDHALIFNHSCSILYLLYSFLRQLRKRTS